MIRKNAFTLIELLVVIAIIAILAAILFPVFAQAKEAAKATQVLSNQKQNSLACQMYLNDTDDILPSYITRNALAPHTIPDRPDIESWVLQMYPYIKNGLPLLPAGFSAATFNVPPNGLQFSPTWDATKWVMAADQPDCDGAGALDSWVPIHWAHSHYGISFPTNTRPGVNVLSGTAAGTQADPDYFFAGSYLPYYLASNVANNYTMNVSTVNQPAGTAFITDGFTGVINSGGFGVTFGCESASMYKGGGNVGFLDSHVKFVKGNNQRYLALDSGGRWYMKFFTVDR